MSTYLVAFVIGDFDYIEGKSSDGIKLRVFTPLGKTEQGRFALEVGYFRDTNFRNDKNLQYFWV